MGSFLTALEKIPTLATADIETLLPQMRDLCAYARYRAP